MLPKEVLKKDRCLIIRCYRISCPKGGRIMSPQSKREYREAIYLRYKEASRREKKPSWMSSVPPAAATANTLSGFFEDSNALQNQSPKREENPPSIGTRPSSIRSKPSGWPRICPVQNASRPCCRRGCRDMLISSESFPRRSPRPC
jgi:hypothetical protein